MFPPASVPAHWQPAQAGQLSKVTLDTSCQIDMFPETVTKNIHMLFCFDDWKETKYKYMSFYAQGVPRYFAFSLKVVCMDQISIKTPNPVGFS